MKPLLVFDVDGTLVDSQGVIIEAMRRAFAHEGLAAPAAPAIREVIGLSLVPGIARLLPLADPETHEKLAKAYKASFHAVRAEGPEDTPFPGMVELVRTLWGEGFSLGVATGKSRQGLARTLAAHRLIDCFITLQTADSHPSKPHPAMLEAAMVEADAAPTRTVMIGDTSYDMAMAKAAGATGLGVGWGYHGAETLLTAGAAHVAASAGDLMDWLMRF
ncbi:MAG: HAD-IA family hydrolase [Pseudomonadota bacterium]